MHKPYFVTPTCPLLAMYLRFGFHMDRQNQHISQIVCTTKVCKYARTYVNVQSSENRRLIFVVMNVIKLAQNAVK